MHEVEVNVFHTKAFKGAVKKADERLESIKDHFIAYPSFWYYFGNAANLIAVKAQAKGEASIYDRYRELAISHFEHFMESNKYALLREDQITSSCALEYIDLLDPVADRHKIYELLDLTQATSGQKCDILQLCAINYLKINEVISAIKLLKCF